VPLVDEQLGIDLFVVEDARESCTSLCAFARVHSEFKLFGVDVVSQSRHPTRELLGVFHDLSAGIPVSEGIAVIDVDLYVSRFGQFEGND